jgi:hypothetical protein
MGIHEGQAVVAGELHPFDETDMETAVVVLRDLYDRDVPEMPRVAPVFDAGAALWSAQFIYRSFQLLLLRQLGPEHIQTELTAYSMPQTAEAIYSADLTLRYLPMVFNLAKRLAPDDPLVQRLLVTGAQWPYSSVGCTINISAIDTDVVLAHPSLSIAYADKVIEAKDNKRILNDKERTLVLSVLGNYAQLLWPGFESSLNMEMSHGK